jgi:hypothetical protein
LDATNFPREFTKLRRERSQLKPAAFRAKGGIRSSARVPECGFRFRRDARFGKSLSLSIHHWCNRGAALKSGDAV